MYLGLIRNYDALAIGEIMMVTGAAQLVMAPVATALERRVDARLLIAAGYALLAVGLVGNGFMTFETDFWGLFWQQLVRGAAIMLCLLPSTALALSGFDPVRVPNASGLFNLMRNLGGRDRLGADRHRARTAYARPYRGHRRAASGRRCIGGASGRPADRAFHRRADRRQVDEATRALVAPLVERAGLVAAFNDAWLLIGGLVLLSMLALPLFQAPRRTVGRRAHDPDLSRIV